MVGAAFRPFLDWLQLPISDPLERRNAVFLQVLLLIVGINVPMMLGYSEWFTPGLDAGLALGMALRHALVGMPAWISLALVRRGRFVGGIWLFLGAWMLSTTLSYTETGMRELPSDFGPFMLMAIGSHMLGRPALWGLFLAISLALTGAVLSDQWRLGLDSRLLVGDLLRASGRMTVCLSVAIILDYTTVALREAMRASIRRELSLQQLSARLQEEVASHRVAQDQLMHAHRVEAVSRIAAGIAHDFGNVLNIVSGYASQRELLAERGSQALVDAMAGIEVAVQRAQRLNRRLLDFSRRGDSVPEVFDAGSALQAAVPLLRQVLGTRIMLCVEANPEPMPILFDKTQFDLVLINMAANARDATPGPGRFEVRADRDGALLVLRFSDQGEGMPSEVLERMFEPFFTSKSSGSGTGLGLTLVRDTVERAGGTVQVESTPGSGTTFRIDVPLARQDVVPLGEGCR